MSEGYGGRGSVDYRTRIVADLAALGHGAWDRLVGQACAGTVPAFLSRGFLDALARTGCVGEDTGWIPEHLTLWAGSELVGAVPLYRKYHSFGEYVFDWAWADAYRRHGLRYYPKLLSAVPFTPVAGARLIVSQPRHLPALVRALLEHAERASVSSLHVLFPRDAEAEALAARGAMRRAGVQFHWRNAGYRDFDAFLASLSQPKRKKIRAERRKVAEAGVSFRRLFGDEIREADWAFFARCYENTYAAHGSSPYLNEAFFQSIGESMPGHLAMVVAQHAGRPIASSLLVRDGPRWYGRYWGATERVDCLHFEAAYYQPIEAAIGERAEVIEGGAQGEHKMARGFLPEATQSLHWLAEPAFADAVDRFLSREGAMVGAYLDELNERSPFQSAGAPDDRGGERG
jgi:hypothetical protein